MFLKCSGPFVWNREKANICTIEQVEWTLKLSLISNRFIYKLALPVRLTWQRSY